MTLHGYSETAFTKNKYRNIFAQLANKYITNSDTSDSTGTECIFFNPDIGPYNTTDAETGATGKIANVAFQIDELINNSFSDLYSSINVNLSTSTDTSSDQYKKDVYTLAQFINTNVLNKIANVSSLTSILDVNGNNNLDTAEIAALIAYADQKESEFTTTDGGAKVSSLGLVEASVAVQKGILNLNTLTQVSIDTTKTQDGGDSADVTAIKNLCQEFEGYSGVVSTTVKEENNAEKTSFAEQIKKIKRKNRIHDRIMEMIEARVKQNREDWEDNKESFDISS